MSSAATPYAVDIHLKMRSTISHQQFDTPAVNLLKAATAKEAAASAKPSADKPTKATEKPKAAAAAAKPSAAVESNDAAGDDEDKLVLTNAVEGQVVTRFPPEASGFLHIGHAKALLVNSMLRHKYKGKMLFRYDDTNPEKEKAVFETAIEEDIAALGVKWDVGPTHSSDYFDLYLEKCEDLIRRDLAYCDMTDKEEMKKCRFDGIATKFRSNTVEQNLDLWEKMKRADPSVLDKAQQKGLCCVRAKMSIDDNNKALRDPTMYRINLTPHVRTGSKYKVYPTYDFCCPIVDSIEGVTHALRTNEYHDRNAQYEWFCDKLGLRLPQVEDFSRLNMEYTVMSKRKLTKLVDEKVVDGWADPRFPTVRGLLRRGLTVAALEQFVKVQGMSKAVNYMEWSKLWNFNNAVIDGNAVRYAAVQSSNAVKCTVTNFDDSAPKAMQRSKHPKNADLGQKTYYQSANVLLDAEDVALIAEGEEVTLMGWGNAFVENIVKCEQTKLPVSCNLRLNPGGDVKKTKKLTWVTADRPEKSVAATANEYDHLLTKKKPDPDEEIDTLINKDTHFAVEMLCEEAIADAKKGDFIQIERRGFYIVDAVEPKMNLIAIPDGKEKVNHLSAKVAHLRAKGQYPPVAAPAAEKKKAGGNAGGGAGGAEMSLEEKRAAKKAKKAASGGK